MQDCHGENSFQHEEGCFHQHTGHKFKEETGELLHLDVLFYGVETWTLRKLEQTFLESFVTWCWRRVENISWTDRVKNEEVLHRVKEERNVLDTIKRRKANWIGHILRRNCLPKHVTVSE
jgi:hypothetical protein